MLKLVASLIIVVVAGLHLWFMVLEMFLWENKLGLRIFRNTPEKAALSAVLAKNQGLYNGFLAAGLLVSFFLDEPSKTLLFQSFFLSCVVIAGVFGAATVSTRIFFIQALPAAIALGLVVYLA